MKKTTSILSVYLLLAGCIESQATKTPELVLNVDSINFCGKVVGETFVWNDLQLRNTGSGPMTIHRIAVRGDESCAFACLYEKPNADGTSKLVECPAETAASGFQPFEIANGTTLLLQVTYTPSTPEAIDQAALVITSDAANIPPEEAEKKTLVVPICGKGLEPAEAADTDTGGMPTNDAGPTSGVDAGLDGGDPVSTCPACEVTLRKGAPGCRS